MSRVIVKGTTSKEKAIGKVAYQDGYFYGFRVGTEATVEDIISYYNNTLCGADLPANAYDVCMAIHDGGYNVGKEDGYEEGYTAAKEKFNMESFRTGYTQGRKEAMPLVGEAKVSSYNQGYEEGFKNGNAYPEETINEKVAEVVNRRCDEVRTEAYEDGKNDLASALLNHLGIEAIEVLDTQSLICLLEERMTKRYADGWDSAVLEVIDAVSAGLSVC